MNEVVAFYRGEVVHPAGTTLEQVLSADHYWLAVKHDYIQWLFPLKKASAAVPGSPILSTAEIEVFRTSPDLRKGLMQSFHKMLRFYGLEPSLDSEKRVTVVRASDFEERKSDWLTAQNHNYRRISRILESLRLLGLPDAAQAFYAALEAVYKEYKHVIGPTTLRYWKDAADL